MSRPGHAPPGRRCRPRRLRPPRRLQPLALCLLLVTTGGLAAGCSRAGGDDAVSFLARAEQTSLAAEAELERRYFAAASRRLLTLLQERGWATLAPDDAVRLRQDALYLLAEAELLQGRPGEALRRADEGLALGGRNDLFEANLQISRGRALEKLRRDAEAVWAYRRALIINEALLEQQLRSTLPPEEERSRSR